MTKDGYEYNCDRVAKQIGFTSFWRTYEGVVPTELFQNCAWMADYCGYNLKTPIKIGLIREDWMEMMDTMLPMVGLMEQVEPWQEPGVKFNFYGWPFIVLRIQEYNLCKSTKTETA